mmetsp:Transcript_29100/g.60651  ORF Transcript_29100/g.60651 Transcript_29100/m.60651 type:complete len:337 (-) Transcript_29100:373-1383(-)
MRPREPLGDPLRAAFLLSEVLGPELLATRLAHEPGVFGFSGDSSLTPSSLRGELDRDLDFPPLFFRLRLFFLPSEVGVVTGEESEAAEAVSMTSTFSSSDAGSSSTISGSTIITGSSISSSSSTFSSSADGSYSIGTRGVSLITGGGGLTTTGSGAEATSGVSCSITTGSSTTTATGSSSTTTGATSISTLASSTISSSSTSPTMGSKNLKISFFTRNCFFLLPGPAALFKKKVCTKGFSFSDPGRNMCPVTTTRIPPLMDSCASIAPRSKSIRNTSSVAKLSSTAPAPAQSKNALRTRSPGESPSPLEVADAKSKGEGVAGADGSIPRETVESSW